MEISKAEREDLARILEIQKQCYAREAERAGDPNIPPMVQTLGELEAEYEGGTTILKGIEDGAIVGSGPRRDGWGQLQNRSPRRPSRASG